MNLDPHADLDWLAFLYVANELSDSDEAAFEDRLAEDQGAREALARAVEMAQTVSAAAELESRVALTRESIEPAGRGRNGWSVPAAWMSLGAAACLLLVAVWSVWANREPGSIIGVHDSQSGTLELAQVWSSLRDELLEDEHEGVENVESRRDTPGGASRMAASRVEDLLLDDLSQLAAPSWLLSAVAVEAGENGLVPPESTESREN